MRILLGFVMLFAVFQAQAYCYLTGVDDDKQPKVEGEPFTIELVTGNSSVTKSVNLNSDRRLSFACFGPVGLTPNQFRLTAVENSNEYYQIKNGVHKLYLKIWLEPDGPALSDVFENKDYFPATVLNTFSYKIKYSVISNFSGTSFRPADINGNIRLDSYIRIKPLSCSDLGDCLSGFYSNANHEYKYYINVIPRFTPTTCTFKSQEIVAQDISYQEIDNNAYAAPVTPQPELECNSTTGVATSNIHYHFEAVSTPENNTLLNELGTAPGSAGEVGFMLKNSGQVINSYPSQEFTLANMGNVLENNSVFPLDLQLRYVRYGNRVYSGSIISKVKVVVDYD